MPSWSVAEPRKLVFDAPVTALHVRIVHGMVNVVGADESAPRLQVSDIKGPPLIVTQEGGTLTVTYEGLPWDGFFKWFDPKSWQRRFAVVSLAVPADTQVELGVIGAGAVVSGIEGRTEVRGVSGDTTLVGLSGPVRAETVSGSVETQGMTGDLRFNSVSGDLTIVDGAGPSVRGDSVSGSMIVDLTSANTSPEGRPTDVSVASVSGEIAIRLPHPADTEVEANTTSGTVSNAFEDLRVAGQWGTKRITGRLGAGQGRLKATTVSGSIALLRRPPTDEPPDDVRVPPQTPVPPGHPESDAPKDTDPKIGSDPGTPAPESRPDAGSPADQPQDRTPHRPQDQPAAPSEKGHTTRPDDSGPRDRQDGAAASDSAASAPASHTLSDAGPTDKKVL